LGIKIEKTGENWKNYLNSEVDRNIKDEDAKDVGK